MLHGETTMTALPSLPVYRARDFRCISGVNDHEPLSFAAELAMEDIYELGIGARRHRISLADRNGALLIAEGSELGQPGARVEIDSNLSLMSPRRHMLELILLVELADDDTVAGVYLYPRTEIVPKTDYTLVGIDTAGARAAFAELGCVFFAAGTRITLPDGAQCPIEALDVGDKVLTRDSGPQEIRWIGHRTVRAEGELSPVMIRKGVLNNAADLLVSPDHRLFVYQRTDEVRAGRSEVMVKARHLVNGTSVLRQPGGFVDYHQLLFDDHQIIYAEGIAAESLMVTRRTRPVLPPDMADRLFADAQGHRRARPSAVELSDDPRGPADIAELLRRASTR